MNNQENTEKPMLSEDGRIKISGFRYDFWKFIIGTVLIGGAGVVSTIIFKNYELKISARTSENNYLNSYISQYTTLEKADSARKFEKVIEMFDVLYIASTDDTLKSKWDAVRKYFTGKIDTLKKEDSLSKKKVEGFNNVIASKQNDLMNVKSRISDLRRTNDTGQIKVLKEKESTLVQSISANEDSLKIAAAEKLKTDKYSNAVLINPPTIIPKAIDSYEVIYDLDRWAAVNYFNQITEGIAVNIDSYNDTDNSVVFRLSFGKEQKTFTLRTGATQPDITLEGDTYKISLKFDGYERRTRLSVLKVAFYHITVQKKKN